MNATFRVTVDPEHWTSRLRAETLRRTTLDGNFAGSEEHRLLIEETVNKVLDRPVQVAWDDNFSYWEPGRRRLAIIKPTGGSEEQVDDTILLLVHETNHARYTTRLGAVAQAAVDRVRRRADQQMSVRVDRFRGFVEDARVAGLAREVDPALGPWIDQHAEMVLRELERGWRTGPPDPIEQGTILVYARLFGLLSTLDTPEPVRHLFVRDWSTLERCVQSDPDTAALTSMRWYADLMAAAIARSAVPDQ